MPRKIRSAETLATRRPSKLVEDLVGELRSDRKSGQPIIEEEHFKTGAIRVVVLWDRWDGIGSENRSAAIVEAYRIVEGDDFADRIALVTGLTTPEALASGMLPVKLFPALRDEDPVSPEQCRQALIEEGASTLLNPTDPELRFSTEEEAKAARGRLIVRLPGSEPCWVILTLPDLKSFQGFDFTE